MKSEIVVSSVIILIIIFVIIMNFNKRNMQKDASLEQSSKAIIFYTMEYKMWEAEYEDHLIPKKAYVDWFVTKGKKMSVSDKLVEEVFINHPATAHYMHLATLENKYIQYKEGNQIFFALDVFCKNLPIPPVMSQGEILPDNSAYEGEEYQKFVSFIESINQNKIKSIGVMDKRYCWFDYDGTVATLRKNREEIDSMVKNINWDEVNKK